MSLTENIHKLSLVELPYSYGDLSPVMSKDTVKYHYEVLSKGYVDRYNNNEGVKSFNKAGALLHNLFWMQLMPPRDRNYPSGAVMDLIIKNHESFQDFKAHFQKACTDFMGSGWVYLSTNGQIRSLVNQSWSDDILMPIDLWEHSYYLDYPADKKSYVKNIWKIINWEIINQRVK